MFNFTLPEIIVILVVALIVVGPNKLPEIGRALGRGIGELKKAFDGVKEQVDSEITAIKQPASGGGQSQAGNANQTHEHEAAAPSDTRESNAVDQRDMSGKDHV